MSDKTILFSGLPNSGKTTFIAALWYYIFYSIGKEKYVFDTLENSELEYLNSISLKWASCEKVIRTNPTNLQEVLIRLKDNESSMRMTLNVPDINGERFNRHFEFRQWEEDFTKVVESSVGILLFVDPRDPKNKPRLIFQESQCFRVFGDERPKQIDQNIPWSETLAPSQVKLVDFLQMINYHRPRAVRKIGVIVSCWDVIPPGTTPQDWCKQNVPLLHQYLNTNDSSFQVKYFGVSSQGGAYGNPDDDPAIREELLKMEPLERIKVSDGTTEVHNILSPILWLTDDN